MSRSATQLRRFMTATSFAVAALVGASAPAAQASPTTGTFSPGEHVFMVPYGVTSVAIKAVGANGGSGGSGVSGGTGAQVTGATLNVYAGQVLYLEVGSNGGRSSGGFNGGGNAGSLAGGGGGASDVRTVSRSQAGSLNSRLLVAPGGGGAWGVSSGAPGGNWESAGQSVAFSCSPAGGAGTSSAGGAGGTGSTGCGTAAGSPGGFGTGGDGSNGGGGGGGWYGGGGGAGLGGGGGGSRYFGTFGSATIQSGDGNPRIELTYEAPEITLSPATKQTSTP
jgi:hypothetical protein